MKRDDIQGLRAIAVLAVLLFHAFPNLFPGGYIGVDVFFVISGYLITGLIFREISERPLYLLEFLRPRGCGEYSPPSSSVLFLTMIAGGFLLSPEQHLLDIEVAL